MMITKKITDQILNWTTLVFTIMIGANPWFFLYSPLNQDFNYQKNYSTYLYSDYNLALNDPGIDQVESIKELPGVESVFSLYRYASRVLNLTNQQQHQTYGVFSEDFSTISISPFNDRRLLAKLENDPIYYAYIDRTIADSLSLELGDEIQITLTTFNLIIPLTVSRIYEIDTMYLTNERSGLVFFPFVLNIKASIESVINYRLRLKTLMIKTTELESNVSFLKANYIPKGRLQDRENFDSQREYDEYYENFMANSYPDDVNNKITDLNIRNQLLIDSINNNLTLSEIIATQLSYIFLFLGILSINLLTVFLVKQFKFEYNRSQYVLNRLFTLPLAFSFSSSFFYFLNIILLASIFPLLSIKATQVTSIYPSFIILLFGVIASILSYSYQAFRLSPKSSIHAKAFSDNPVVNFWYDVQYIIPPSKEAQQFQWVFNQVKKFNQRQLTHTEIKLLVEEGKVLYLKSIKNENQ